MQQDGARHVVIGENGRAYRRSGNGGTARPHPLHGGARGGPDDDPPDHGIKQRLPHHDQGRPAQPPTRARAGDEDRRNAYQADEPQGFLEVQAGVPVAISFERDDTVNRPTKMGKAGAMGPV